jgi:GT2 family glycosyltransferase
MLMSRAALEHIGLLDMRYFAFVEELDWCLRAQEAGFRVLHVPAAQVWHRWTSTAPSALEQFLVSRNSIWLALRHCTGLSRFISLGNCIFMNPVLRAAHAIRKRDLAGGAAALQGVTWHVGLFRRHNPLVLVNGVENRSTSGT